MTIRVAVEKDNMHIKSWLWQILKKPAHEERGYAVATGYSALAAAISLW